MEKNGEIDWDRRLIHCGQCKKDMTILSETIDELNRAWVNHSIEHFQGKTKRKPRDKGAIV